ncbi:Gypsy retrotransposon integrase-like protein 1 [Elasticomyces elasticus]|uniref:Gypsy retrotransposon integrase-like protein 1 n=1 Tax=Exophiala sideris TaxID=1016849 RepID=A0ABR0J5H5_9EURO|nr:Gypsy retrotransposon integrase-like protein 1 [Elasticomyces elasticus]KAK5027032.1 Gypsy retrotransposon integrase-like protein 1 [Exophiala sideris]KAK5034036.1 Gypsy retrotransposon integrase-like protein 1 [Exophiala sideris]KAK5055689.1 Gypsy retrotransposon integrase-like protein 1 [Exophiala sideris]KAK5180978.1 Gypsy retrotransposon integrase-like protein 1 [Eurotiomycetes sp. CCFEE 6388]
MANGLKGNLDVIARRKSTLACQECRRRRAKCNGFQSCDHCAAYGIDCIYDTRRQRRGPKPKSQQHNASSNQAVDRLSPNVDVGNGFRTPETVENLRRETWVSELPAFQVWHPDLKNCLTSLEGRCSDAGDVDLICHLVELFYTHVYVQQTPPWSVGDFYVKLKSGKKAIARLCLAMAAASTKYLVHDTANNASEGCKGDTYARQARISLLELVDGDLVERAQTLCTLSIYEMYRANGVQAWCDIELARNYVQILNATHNDVSTITEAVTLAGDFIRTIELMYSVGNPGLSFSSPQYEMPLFAPVEGRTRLIRLLELFTHIQSLVQKRLGTERHSHWRLDSPYRHLQTKLDEYALQQPEVFSLSQESLQKSIGSGSIDQFHCTLM